MPNGTGRPARLSAVAVYCGSNRGTDPAYARAAASMGRLLAQRRIRLVYGGGHVGLMGVIADAVLGAGGEVHGVITSALRVKEIILLDTATRHGFVALAHRDLVIAESEPEALLDRLAAWTPVRVSKWLDTSQR